MEPRKRFMPVFKQIVHFQEFLGGPQLDIAVMADVSSHSRSSIAKANQAAIDSDLNMATNLLDFGERLLNGTLTGDQFFRETLLQSRLQYLSNRTIRAINSCRKTDLILPSDPYCFECMRKYELKSNNEASNEYANARNVQRYQFLNLLCSTLYKILRRDELSEGTVKLLRASPKLWPLLRGETKDLGHPDEAGGFAIVNAYLQYPFRGGEGLDGKRGLNPLEKAAIRIEKKVFCPLWEQEKLRNDAALCEAHYEKRTNFTPFEGLGCPSDQGIYQELTLFECGEWKEDLPYPPFLQPVRQNVESEEVVTLNEPSFFEAFPFEQLEESEEVLAIQDELAPQVMFSSSLSQSGQSLITARSIDEEVVAEPAAEQVDSYEETSASSCLTPGSSALPAPSASASTTYSFDFIMPSGIRKFHAFMPQTPYLIQQLAAQDQAFVDQIFDKRRFRTLTFKEFRLFWEKQKGTIVSSHGGSHQLLIGPKGDSLFGTYAHGGGQTYTPKTIKYLQAALWYIGCRPSE
ncbi:MAG: hypothetical protein K2P93_01135 [Alphaproteobacteria bacterium]|nr:hypothetical protein [Alphaproteobacteria bacterium]